jgi:ribosomal protein S18 acetylase RimI-like enzyme
MRPSILTEASEQQLADAVQENLFASFRAMASLPKSEIIEGERFSMHHAFPDNPVFKGVWKSRFSTAETQTQIDQAESWFRQRGASGFFWWTDAYTQPANLAQTLLQAGFDGNLEGDQGMAADLHALNEYVKTPQSLKIMRAIEPKALNDWGKTLAAANEMPVSNGLAWVDAIQALGGERAPWQLYVGYVQDQPVGTSMLFNGTGVAGISAIGTLHAQRGRGIGSAMTLKALQEARRMGYRYAVLYASWQGLSVYRRLGFHEVPCKIGIYYKEIAEGRE